MASETAAGNGQEKTSSQESGVGLLRCFRIFSKLTAALAGMVTLASLASSALTDWPVGPIAETVLGVIAAALLGFHMINFEVRVFLGHWTIPEIHRSLCAEMVLGSGVPAAILLAILYLPPSWEMLAGMSLLLLLAYAFYEPAQQNIRNKIQEEDLWQGTDYFGTMQPLEIVGDPKGIFQIAETQNGPNLQSLLAFFVGKPWIPGLSRTRTVILCLMIMAFLTSTAAAADVWVQRHVHPGPGANAAIGRAEALSISASPPPDSTKATSPSGGAEEQGIECDRMPGDGAPAWAKADLNSLYLGRPRLNATPPPGLIVGGCPTGVVIPAAGGGDFLYEIGENATGEVRSVAVDSKGHGPAIFLAPAAQQILELIHRGQMPIGGYPTVQAGGGDMAPVLTPHGTLVLVRSSVHLPGKTNFATPYVELPPTVAAAWVGAMREAGGWLWPHSPERRGNAEAFPLVGTIHDRHVQVQVDYDRSSGTAGRDSFTYELPQDQLGQYELEALAAGAPYADPPVKLEPSVVFR